MRKYRFMSPGDIFICDFGKTCGSEQGGKRPAIIVSEPKQSACSPTVQVVPITTANKKISLPTHYFLYKTDYPRFDSKINLVLCEQIRTIDKGRLGQKLGKLSYYDLYNVIVAVRKNFSV